MGIGRGAHRACSLAELNVVGQMYVRPLDPDAMQQVQCTDRIAHVFHRGACKPAGLHAGRIIACLCLQARHGYEMVRKWVDGSEGLLSLHPVEATALAFVR